MQEIGFVSEASGGLGDYLNHRAKGMKGILVFCVCLMTVTCDDELYNKRMS